MAETYIDPSNGAFTHADFGADFGSMDITEAYQTESVAAYGAAVYDPHLSNATPHMSLSVGAFAKKGAATKDPGFGSHTNAGGAATATVDTGVTLAGDFVVRNIRLQHARLRAAVPLTFDLENSGDITTTWPTS